MNRQEADKVLADLCTKTPFRKADHGSETTLHPSVLHACVTGGFDALVAWPLMASKHARHHALLGEIGDALPAYWWDKHSRVFVDLRRLKGERGRAILEEKAHEPGEGEHARRARRQPLANEREK